MHDRLWILIICLTVICASLAGCVPAGALPSSTATQPAQATLIPSTPTVPAAQKSNPSAPSSANMKKISSRLQILLSNPELVSASPAEQSKAFSLPPSGAGSIRVDEQGRVQVNIRVQDVSEGTIQALKDAGAVVLSVSKQYMVIAAYVSPLDLAAISNLTPVLSLEEELSPELQDRNGS